jgi:cytochrome c-type biogenesis protein CcmE
MKPRHKRMALIVAGLATLGLAATLVLNAFRSNMVFFFTPSQIAAHEATAGRSLRIGGLVVVGSIKRDGVKVHFIVTDTAKSIPVVYTGILPDLFKEGKGVVAEGELGANGVFQATQVLAKHDENYMPPEAAEALKRAQASGESTGKSLVMDTESAPK